MTSGSEREPDDGEAADAEHSESFFGEGQQHLEKLVAEVVADAVEATRVETRAQVAAAPDTIDLRDGRRIGSTGVDQLWSFDVDEDVAPLPETPGTLIVDGLEPITVRVLAVGDESLVLGLSQELGEHVTNARLSMSAAFVNDMMAQRLKRMVFDADVDLDMVEALLLPETDEFGLVGVPPEVADQNEDDQSRSARLAVEPGLRFTWGPPGTGKTTVLAMAVARAVEAGGRVLVLAHANAAVDVAIARIADELGDSANLQEGRVLRVGTPHLPVALERPEVLPDRILARRYPKLVARKDELTARRRELSDESRVPESEQHKRQVARELGDIRSQLADIGNQLATATQQLLDQAVVVATTLAKLVVSQPLWDWRSDIVIVDEASMAGLPFVLAVAARGAETLSIFGDFRQLPPIAVSSDELAQQWFARDVFELAGVVEAHDDGRPDRRMSVLRTQFRMGEQVCDTISEFAYDGMLTTHQSARVRAIRLAEMTPVVGSEVVIVDTSTLGGACVSEAAPAGFSRFAPLSAALAATLAGAASSDQDPVDIGLISPYRAQTSLFAALARDLAGVTASTIHRFQGSERDVVVLDLVDSPNQTRPSRLTGSDPEFSKRLLNVAASRARGKLIILADRAFVEDAHPLNSSGRKLLECADDAGAETIDAALLLAGMPAPVSATRPLWFESWIVATKELQRDISGSARVDLHVPEALFSGPWLADSLADVKDLSSVVLRSPPTVARGVARAALDVRLRTTASGPWAIIDEEVLWVGARTPMHPVTRITSPQVVRAFRRLMSVAE